jgi:GMP synthase (glutamine-hydrolysing)
MSTAYGSARLDEVHVLGVIHGARARSGLFGDVLAERGHPIEEWSLAWGTPPPRPLEEYGAVIVFGGAMHADQDEHHPWLREENLFIQRLLVSGTPFLGVCLGAQLLAKAAGAPVMPAAEPEIGWRRVTLNDAAADDPVLGALPASFEAFQWHYYTYGVPAAGAELGRSAICTQAFRLGESAWGVQFHPEVKRTQIEGWIVQERGNAPVDLDVVAAETERKIAAWNELGAELVGAFADVFERRAVAQLAA